MSNKSKIISVLGSIVVVIILFFFFKNDNKNKSFSLSKEIDSYGLYTHRGNLFEIDSILNSPTIFFFGFLNCPDICPNTLSEISDIIVKLGDKRKKIDFLFVTVDPERDTISNMRKYLDNFNENIIGITGNEENLKKFLKSMHVYYEKVFISEDFYTIDHSSQMYIFEKNGKFFGTISLNENQNIVFEKIKSVI